MSEEIELPELEEEVPGATKKPPMTSEEKQDAVELFGEGISIADIARKYDRTAQHFSQMFRAMNLTRGEVRRIRKEAEAAAANAVAAARETSDIRKTKRTLSRFVISGVFGRSSTTG